MGLHQIAKEILKSPKYYSISEFTVASLSKHLELCAIQNLDDIKPTPHILYRLNTDLLIKYSTIYKMFEEGSFNSVINVKYTNANSINSQKSEIRFLSQEHADQFLQTFQLLLTEYNIDPDGLSFLYNTTHLDNLLTLSYIFDDINFKYKQEEEHQRKINKRRKMLVSLLKFPFKKQLNKEVVWLERKHGGFSMEEVGFRSADLIKKGISEKDIRKHSVDKPFFYKIHEKELEFSTDIQIKINSNFEDHEINVDEALSRSVLEVLVKNVIDEIKLSDTGFYDQLCTWDGDLDKLEYATENRIKDLFTRKVTEYSIIVADYLNEHHLLKSTKGNNVSQAQSSFLFKYFALFDFLERQENYELNLKKAQEMNKRKHISNSFKDRVDAQVRSYNRPSSYIKETVKDNRQKIKE